ncbi:TcpE family conjugal transfer membrane protein [Nonomuraea guangzhouensis]|uniref:TcpE family conjugal transfer membrane protein n=1 Tax=Nonomuraea guangzhouensis TaxID=1291555 RepID=A0ABW4GSB6_9ACTN|nr:TcpE family conjugal transfer membrane protein [Nonomuraea guangzhouensis]
MDLPTYTNIWRIEKRLYKLYDLRLPMPLPIVWIGVFVGVLAPWSLLLMLVGIQFHAPWHVLYLVPPGIVTWLSTRPVIENKRLTELLQSQLRYVGEPRAWCRMAPTAEPEVITFAGRVWRVTPKRAKAPRKARQPQRKRRAELAIAAESVAGTKLSAAGSNLSATGTKPAVGAEPVTGPRQVRPAVAAAAAAAAQAPVAESRPARPGWGSAPRRGTAPALGADLAAQSETPTSPDKTLAMGSRSSSGMGSRGGTRSEGTPLDDYEVPQADERRRGAAGRDEVPRTGGRGDSPASVVRGKGAAREGVSDVGRMAGFVPGADESQAVQEAHAVRETREVRGTREVRETPVESQSPEGAAEGRNASRVDRPAASGKPIDTEALRRLRKLAASADTPPPSETARTEVTRADAARAETARADATRQEAARGEVARAEATRAEVTRQEAAQAEATRPETAGSETAGLEAARSEATRAEVTRQEVGRAEATHADAIPQEAAHAEATRPETAGSETADPEAARTEVLRGGVGSRDVAAGGVVEEGRRAEAGGSSGEGSRQDAGVSEEVRAPGADEVARDQHRKGQPPRQGPSLVLPDAQRLWPLSPEGKPVRFIRPVTGDDEAQETAPVGRDEPTTTASVHEIGPARSERARQDVGPAKTERAGQDVGPARSGRAGSDASEPGRAAASRAEPAGSGTFESGPGEREPGGRAPAARQVAPGPKPGERVRRVESVVGRDSGGWRRIAQVVVGGGNVRTDGSEVDEARARAVFSGSRRVVVLGCTGGAGQSTTALMLGHTFATYRDDRVVAIDANTGGNTLTSKIEPETPETLASLLSGLDRVSGYLTMRGYTTRTTSGLEVIGADTDAGAEQRLSDRTLFSDHRLGQVMHLLDRHYKLAVMDPAAALAARVLPYADQLVLVVPASEEAAEAVAMTYEWLDGHGCADLRRRAVMVVNGVSRRSMADVEQAESVARGRCRAIVRVPWEDDLAPGGDGVVDPGQLRAAGRRAYLALAGVVVAGFAAKTVRPSEEELASDPPGTRIGER